MPKLFRVVMPVSDIARAREFYEHVLGCDGKLVSPGRVYFDCESTILACYDPRADGDDGAAEPLSQPLYFAVDDIEEVFRRVREAGGELSSAVVADVGALGTIATRPWGERSFYATDPFGNPLCFVSRHTAFTG